MGFPRVPVRVRRQRPARLQCLVPPPVAKPRVPSACSVPVQRPEPKETCTTQNSGDRRVRKVRKPFGFMFQPVPYPSDTSAIRRVQLHIARQFALPTVAVRQKLVLVVIKFLARFRRELEIRPLDDGVDRAGFLAEAAIDALHHVDVVAYGATRTIIAARAGLDGDRLRRADRFAQLAGDAALFPIGIAAQRMFATETRADWSFFVRIVDRFLGREELAQAKRIADDNILEKQRYRRLAEPGHHANPVSLRNAAVATTMNSEIGRNTFQPRRINWS